jgi:hypothetical protein
VHRRVPTVSLHPILAFAIVHRHPSFLPSFAFVSTTYLA